MLRSLLALAIVALAPCSALAQTRSEAAEEPEVDAPDEGSESRSVGVPDRGRLIDPAQLDDTDHLFIRTSRRSAHYGTAELVGLIRRAARAVADAHPGPRLVVGDLSRRRGGRFGPHRSHQSGRDADVGFFLNDAEGETTQAEQFVSLRRDGCGTVRDDRFCFDAPRNWALIAAMVQDEEARVQYVLIAPDIRRRLLDEGERQGAPPELVERVRTVTEPHSGSHSHRSHFHVRIYCPPDDRPRCIDEPPYHDWYEGEPAPPTAAVRRMRARQRSVRMRRRRAQARRRAARQRRLRARRRQLRQRRQRLRERRQRLRQRRRGGDATATQ